MSSAEEVDNEFVAFLKRNDQQLRRCAYRYATWADAAISGDDVYARAVLRGWLLWSGTVPWEEEGDSRLFAWLLNVMAKVAREDLRAAARTQRMRRRLKRVVVAEPASRRDETADRAVAREALRVFLPYALDALPPDSRTLWELKMNGVADSDIAEMFGIEESTVRSRFSRVRARLYEDLSPDIDARLGRGPGRRQG